MNDQQAAAGRPAPGSAATGSSHAVRFARKLTEFQDRSERLVGWVQLAIISVLGGLYFVSPMTPDSTQSELRPVPIALALYTAFTMLKLALAYRRTLPGWLVALSIVIDMALLFVLIWSFHLDYQQPPAFYLKAPTLLYVFIFIALRTLRFEVFYVLLAGACAAVGWLALAAYAALGTQDLLGSVTRDYVTYMTSPRILWGAEIDKIIAIVLVTGVLAVAVSRARSLLERERDTAVELEDRRAEIADLAYRDRLTRLPNLAGVLERFDDHGRPIGLVVVELEDLRRRIAVLGRAFTDLLVAEMRDRIVGALRPGTELGRISQSEFLVCLPETTDFSALNAQAGRILKALAPSASIDGRSVIQTAKIGLAVWKPDAGTLRAAIEDAQVAALRARAPATPAVVAFDDRMRQEELAFNELEAALRTALDDGERFAPHYQPIYEISSGRLVGFEALARWTDPRFGTVSPARFIPVAEATGLIVPLGRRILKTACQDLLRLDPSSELGRRGAGLFMSVNVSPRQLADRGLLARFGRALERARVRPDRVKLELTETAAIGALEDARARLSGLKEMGVSLSIDDFGTGYSSLSHLHDLPFDTLKIDRSFVRDVSASERSRAVVRTIVELSRGFGLDTVAEGIEDEATLTWLQTLGVDKAQGYFTGKPMPLEHAVGLASADTES